MADEKTTDKRASSIRKSKAVRNDEFYTLRSVIDAELQHYEHHFRGKVVYCPCDDPAWSKFVEYFTDNYDRLGLAGLETNYLRPDGTGDFRSREAVAKLERADIVVTNPPFSLFRHFITQLIEPEPEMITLLADVEPLRDKKFLLIAGMHSLVAKQVFRIIVDERAWCGITLPIQYSRPDGSITNIQCRWLTNLEHPKMKKTFVLKTRFADMQRVKFDNYDAINVDKIKDIPCDYDGVMGVPTTILDGLNQDQFEVLELLMDREINKVSKFNRVLIKNRIIVK